MFYIEEYPELIPPIIIFLMAFFVALHCTWLMRQLALRFGLLDHPNARKKQATAVPSGGGVAIVIGVAISVLLTYGRSTEVRLILGVGLGIALVGLLDDMFSVRAWIKLLVLAAGCLVLTLGGIGLNRTPYLVINFILTFLWVASISSAFNAMDNADGLAGTIAAVSALALFAMGWSTWQLQFSFLAMSLAGSVLGFLHFNFKPARIYMGDTGSFFLGYILAVLVLYGHWSESGTKAFLGGVLVLGLPIYDLGVTTILRIRHGVVRSLGDALSYSDGDHLSHRLRCLGFSHRQMLAILCGASITGSLLAGVVIHASWRIATVAVFLAILLLSWAIFYLDTKTSSPGLWTSRKHLKQKVENGERQ